MRQNSSWQAHEDNGFDLAHFEIDWEHKVAICPENKKSISWKGTVDRRQQPNSRIKFSQKDCGRCPSRSLCMRGAHKGSKKDLTIYSRPHYEALKLARQRESSPHYITEYAKRSGIEGTVSRALRVCDARHARYRGLQKVHLGHTLIAGALNFVRVGEWFSGKPKVTTRRSPFVELMELQAA